MNKIVNEKTIYYGTLDTTKFGKIEMEWLTNKKIEYVIKHKYLGYCVRLFDKEIENIKKTMTIDLAVWPDNDSYTVIETFKINGIYADKNIIEEVYGN